MHNCCCVGINYHCFKSKFILKKIPRFSTTSLLSIMELQWSEFLTIIMYTIQSHAKLDTKNVRSVFASNSIFCLCFSAKGY